MKTREVKVRVDFISLTELKTVCNQVVQNYTDTESFYSAEPQTRMLYYVVKNVFDKCLKKLVKMNQKGYVEDVLKLDYVEAEALLISELPIPQEIEDQFRLLLI